MPLVSLTFSRFYDQISETVLRLENILNVLCLVLVTSPLWRRGWIGWSWIGFSGLELSDSHTSPNSSDAPCRDLWKQIFWRFFKLLFFMSVCKMYLVGGILVFLLHYKCKRPWWTVDKKLLLPQVSENNHHGCSWPTEEPL